jgi:hypothetical protein
MVLSRGWASRIIRGGSRDRENREMNENLLLFNREDAELFNQLNRECEPVPVFPPGQTVLCKTNNKEAY